MSEKKRMKRNHARHSIIITDIQELKCRKNYNTFCHITYVPLNTALLLHCLFLFCRLPLSVSDCQSRGTGISQFSFVPLSPIFGQQWNIIMLRIDWHNGRKRANAYDLHAHAYWTSTLNMNGISVSSRFTVERETWRIILAHALASTNNEHIRIAHYHFHTLDDMNGDRNDNTEMCHHQYISICRILRFYLYLSIYLFLSCLFYISHDIEKICEKNYTCFFVVWTCQTVWMIFSLCTSLRWSWMFYDSSMSVYHHFSLVQQSEVHVPHIYCARSRRTNVVIHCRTKSLYDRFCSSFH